jgi:N4-gp56 family major capsid protein
MVTTNFDLQLFANTTIPDALICRAWAKQFWTEAGKDCYFDKFTGTGTDNIIQVKTELQKDKGDQITIPLLMNLKGDGITGDATLEGNEEAMQFYDHAVRIDQLRHAVRLQGQMEEQKSKLDLRTAAKDSLKRWFAEKQELMIVDALTKDPTPEHLILPNGRDSESDITASDVFTADMISIAARKAKTMSPKIRRVNVKGKQYYIMLIDNYQARDLKKDEKWLDAQKYCAERGEDNPIFTGMLGVYDGVVLHEYENLHRTNTGASGATVGHALLLGCQAGVKGVGKEAFWREKAFDYDNQVGFATGAIFGFSKAKFNDKDFAVIQVMTSSADD